MNQPFIKLQVILRDGYFNLFFYWVGNALQVEISAYLITVSLVCIIWYANFSLSSKLSSNMDSWWNVGILLNLPTIPQIKQRQNEMKMLPGHWMFFPVTAAQLRHLQSCPRCALKARNHLFNSSNSNVTHIP